MSVYWSGATPPHTRRSYVTDESLCDQFLSVLATTLRRAQTHMDAVLCSVGNAKLSWPCSVVYEIPEGKTDSAAKTTAVGCAVLLIIQLLSRCLA